MLHGTSDDYGGYRFGIVGPSRLRAGDRKDVVFSSREARIARASPCGGSCGKRWVVKERVQVACMRTIADLLVDFSNYFWTRDWGLSVVSQQLFYRTMSKQSRGKKVACLVLARLWR